MLQDIVAQLAEMVSDYEVVVVDNASEDGSVDALRALTAEGGLPNLQVYTLANERDMDVARWVGVENALGDFVALFNPQEDDLSFLPTMLEAAVAGKDIVFAENTSSPKEGRVYAASFGIFKALYKRLSGVGIEKTSSRYQVLSRKVVNYLLQHSDPAATYRHLASAGGFSQSILRYAATVSRPPRRKLRAAVNRGVKLLVSTTQAPMRLVTLLTLFGAGSNLVYSVYVIAVALLKSEVAEGWVTLSLQQSGMFFLISIVLLLLAEYVMHMARLSNEGPRYFIAQEFTSARLTRRERLNLELAGAQQAKGSANSALNRLR